MKANYSMTLLAISMMTATAWGAENIQADSTETKIGLTDSNGREVVVITRDKKEQGGFSLNVAGMTIDFTDKKRIQRDDTTKPSRKPSLKPSLDVGNPSIGFIGLTTPDYSIYPAETGKFLRLDNVKSISLAFDAAVVNLPLDRRNVVGLRGGLRFKWDNYAFSGRNRLIVSDGMIQPQATPEERRDYKKSKLTTFSVNMPLTLRVQITRNLAISGGVYGDLVLRQHTKVKFPKEKSKGDFGVNFFQYGLIGQIGLRKSVSVYFQYGLTPLFESGAGPKTYPFSVGVNLFRW